MKYRTGFLKLCSAIALGALLVACGKAGSTETEGQPAGAESGGGLLGFMKKTREVTVPAGTVLTVEFDQTLSSARSAAGEGFSARVVDPVSVDGVKVIEPGATVAGKVISAVPSKRIGGRAKLNLEFTSLELPSGGEAPIDASFYAQAKSQTKKDATTIGGATAGGALLGRIIGHNDGKEADGTAIGAVVGAAVGTGIAASNRGQEVTIPAGTTMQIRLDSPVTVSVPA